MQRLTRDSVSRLVPADPQQVYDLVSDVPRTPEWSPQVIACSWLDGATGPAVGARFVARNKLRWFAWANRPVVDVAEPGREFTISRTEPGGGTMRWSYRLKPEPGGTLVELSYEAVRRVPLGLHLILRTFFGVRDLQADLHVNMVTSLDRIASLVSERLTSP